MMLARFILPAVFASLLSCWAGVVCGQLPERINNVLDALDIPAGDVSIVVERVADGSTVLSHLPDAARNPASVMKLVTTYSALEVLTDARRASPQSDIYSLGATLFQLLTGRSPDQLRYDVSGTAVNYLPKEFVDVVGTACQREPEDRYQDVVEFGRALVVAANAWAASAGRPKMSWTPPDASFMDRVKGWFGRG